DGSDTGGGGGETPTIDTSSYQINFSCSVSYNSGTLSSPVDRVCAANLLFAPSSGAGDLFQKAVKCVIPAGGKDCSSVTRVTTPPNYRGFSIVPGVLHSSV